MNTLFWADQILSVLLVNFCWWLSHENSSSKLPLRRLMAMSYAVMGVLIMGNMLLRTFVELRPFLPWALIMSKVCLVVVFGLAGLRQTMVEKANDE